MADQAPEGRPIQGALRRRSVDEEPPLLEKPECPNPDLRLKPDSPAINAGYPKGNNVDIGANEYIAPPEHVKRPRRR